MKLARLFSQWADVMVRQVVAWPRLIRIALIALFALSVTLAVSPLVDYIYSEYFFSYDTVIVPALVSASMGLIMYLMGWWLLVGTVGEPLLRRPLGQCIYLVTGLIAIGVVIYLVVTGIQLVNADKPV